MLMKRPYANADEALAGAKARHADAKASRVEVDDLIARLRPEPELKPAAA